MCCPWLKTSFRNYYLLHVTFAKFSLVALTSGFSLESGSILSEVYVNHTFKTTNQVLFIQVFIHFPMDSLLIMILNMELSNKHPYLKTTPAHTAWQTTCDIQQCFKMLTNPDLLVALLKSLMYSISIQDSITNSLHHPLELLWETDRKIHSRSWGSIHSFLTRASEPKKVAVYWGYAECHM